MTITLGDDGQDWRIYFSLLKAGGSPKKNSEVTSGCWRLENAGAFAAPVTTYFDGPMPTARINGGKPIDTDCGDDWHLFCTRTWPKLKAVPSEDYDSALDSGFWPDGMATTSREAIGGNSPPVDAVEQMLKEARENVAKAKKLADAGAAKTQKAADAAAVLSKALTAPQTELKEHHRIEKEPHLDAGRVVDARFLPLIKEMGEHVKLIRDKVTRPFMQAQEQIAAAAAAAAQKVLDDAAAAQAAEEAAAAKERGEPVTDEAWNEAAPAAPAVTVTTAKVSVGAKGAKSSLRDVKYGVIEDYAVFAAALAKSRNAEILALLDQIGNRMARGPVTADMPKGGQIYPGLKLDIRRE